MRGHGLLSEEAHILLHPSLNIQRLLNYIDLFLAFLGQCLAQVAQHQPLRVNEDRDEAD
jgi:hypothetical protein